MNSPTNFPTPQPLIVIVAFVVFVFTLSSNQLSAQKAAQSIAPQVDIVPSQHTGNSFGQPVDLSGTWRGSWISCKNGHNGKLRATFCRLNDHQVQAVFVGSFAKVLPFRYKATLDIVREDSGSIVLRGSKRLGPIMGTFSYQATVTGNSFSASYSSKRDCGKWSMQRCCQ